MSHRSAVRSAAHHGHAHGFGRATPGSKYSPPQTGWTLGHGGRQVRVGPVAFWTIVGSLVVMAGWSAVTATYFAFRDDVLTRLLARQAQMQYAYEDRIADLRGQVDKLASRQLLDQEQVESKLEQIARRQATLESRSIGSLHHRRSLPDRLDQDDAAPGRARCSLPQTTPKPSPINDTVILVPPPEREARLESRTPMNSVRLAAASTSAGIEGGLARLQLALDRYEAQSGQDAEHAGRELRRQGAAHAQHSGRPRARSRQDRAGPAATRERRPVRAGKRAATSRRSIASSIGSSWCAGRSSG